MREVIESKDLGERDGFDLAAEKVYDHDSTPHDADCYDAEDIEAWKRNEWRYVGVVVTASRDGVKLGEASIWGTEDGYSPGWEGYADAFGHTLGDYYDVPADAIADARAKLRGLVGAVVVGLVSVTP